MERFGRKTRRSLGAVLVGLVALAATATAIASHPTVTYSSPFNSTNENFSAIAGAGVNPTTWQASGGNPSGFITTTFASGGGFIQSASTGAGSTWPAANALGDYGGTLGADVRVHLNGTAPTEDLVIGLFSTNSVTWACEDLGTPTSSWATYTVTLATSSKLIDCDSGKRLTDAQASAALAGFESIVILAANQDGVEEIVDVDNAFLSPPDLAATPPTGKVARKLTLAYKAHKLTGSLLSVDDYSCVGKMKLTIFEKAKKPVKVGTVTTSAPNENKFPAPATFSFKLKKSAKGKFYASAAKATSKLDGNSCTAATSKNVTVR